MREICRQSAALAPGLARVNRRLNFTTDSAMLVLAFITEIVHFSYIVANAITCPKRFQQHFFKELPAINIK